MRESHLLQPKFAFILTSCIVAVPALHICMSLCFLAALSCVCCVLLWAEWMKRACDAESAQTPSVFLLDPGKERQEVKYMLTSKVTSCFFVVLLSEPGRFNFNILHLIWHQPVYVHRRSDVEAVCGICTQAQTHTRVDKLKNSLFNNNNSNHCIFIPALHYGFASQICKYYHKTYLSICISYKSWPDPSLRQFESRN